MKRLTILLLSLFYFSAIAQAAPEPQRMFQKNVHYKEINGATSSYRGGKVDVLELLWYGCPTCYMIQPNLEHWATSMGDAINYRRMPAVTNDDMLLLARAFYAAEVLGVMGRVHKRLFHAIHESRRQMMSESDVVEFFEEQGVEKKDFESALNSKYVNNKLQRAKAMASRLGIQGAPSIVVDGKYLVDPSMVRSPQEFVEVIDFLVNKVRTTVRSG